MAQQVLWLTNWKTKLPNHAGAAGFDATRLASLLADANWLIYVLGAWIGWIRSSAESATQYVTVISTGLTGGSALDAPIFTAPAPVSGTVAVPAGALTWLFAAVQDIKDSTSYTPTIGEDLQIIGPEVNPEDQPVPVFSTKLEQGATHQNVVFNIKKYTHQGVVIESKRGGGAWEQIGITTARSFTDERALLVAGQPEVREYRLRDWDKGIANGPWTDVSKTTVAP